MSKKKKSSRTIPKKFRDVRRKLKLLDKHIGLTEKKLEALMADKSDTKDACEHFPGDITEHSYNRYNSEKILCCYACGVYMGTPCDKSPTYVHEFIYALDSESVPGKYFVNCRKEKIEIVDKEILNKLKKYYIQEEKAQNASWGSGVSWPKDFCVFCGEEER